MQSLIYALLSTLVVSLISLIGIFSIYFKQKKLEQLLLPIVSYATGVLMGGAFIHLLPEALNELSASVVMNMTLIGFSLFYVVERLLHWHHCHRSDHKCKTHTFGQMNLIGDAIHNFMDGIIIIASFTISFKLGIATFFAIILHEIPQEIGDFGILLFAGYTRTRALVYNFISALFAVLGCFFGYFILGQSMLIYFLPITAGGFIYIAGSDLIPELHKETKLKKSVMSFAYFLLGIFLMYLMKIFLN